MLHIHYLSKSFGQRNILNRVSFEINKGEIALLLGPSGSGKSTLLRCLNLLEQADEGTITLENLHITCGSTAIPPHIVQRLRSHMGMVFQRFHLWPHMNVWDNLLEAPRLLSKRPKEELEQEALEFLEKIGLQDKVQAYPHELSGGEQQRIAIARSWMMHPKVMLFDEPTASLDPEKVSALVQMIKALSARGQTMLISTHEVSFAQAVATKVFFLEEGQIAEQGDASILTAPQTQRFKAFLSS